MTDDQVVNSMPETVMTQDMAQDSPENTDVVAQNSSIETIWLVRTTSVPVKSLGEVTSSGNFCMCMIRRQV